MSDPQYILVPVQSQNGQPLQVGSPMNVSDPDQLHNIARTIQHQNNPLNPDDGLNSQAGGEKRDTEEHDAEDSSLVKQVTSDPSVLYSFINWENPGKTFASLITVMSIIISTRYLSPLQWILKILCSILGATSLVEVIGRVVTNEGIMARVRPQPYYHPSERTYSRLFSEIQEAVDMTLLKLQNVIFADDLQGTIIGFASTFIAYWLVKAIPPFWLAITATVLTYSLGPILTGSRSTNSNATNLKPAIDQKARDLRDRAANAAASATNRTANIAQELSSRAMDTASSASNVTTAKAQDIKDYTTQSTAYATERATGVAQELKNRTTKAADSATKGTGTVGNGTGTQHAISNESAPPNAPGFDDNNMSKDRRTQLHPLASEIRNTAL